MFNMFFFLIIYRGNYKLYIMFANVGLLIIGIIKKFISLTEVNANEIIF